MGRDVLYYLRAFVPAAKWGAQYDREMLGRDALAGLTVGVMLIPQGVAYAAIAGMPPIYGLYASVVPLLVYPLLGTSRQLAVGPIAVDMVIVAAGVGVLAAPTEPRYVTLVVLLAAMNGVLQLAMGAFRLGFLADLLSRPVIVGFTTAAAVIIAAGQLGNLTGVDLPRTPFAHEILWALGTRLGAVHLPTLALGLAGAAVLFALQWWKPHAPGALVLAVLGAGAVLAFDLEARGVELIGTLPTGLPEFSVPTFSIGDVRELLPTALTLALVQFMSVVSLGRVFARRHDYEIRPNQELLAVGAANLVGSFFRGIPVSGSFSRSAVNDRAGARTPLANVVTAAVIALALLVLTPLFYFLPMPALAAIIIVAATGLLDVDEVRTLFREKSRDGALAVFTAATTLVVGIQEGLLLGVGASVLMLLYQMSRPNMVELGHLRGTRSFRDLTRRKEAEQIAELLVLRVDAPFSFVNAGAFKTFILERSHVKGRPIRAVIVDGSSIGDLDSTAVDALRAVVRTLDEEGIGFYLAELHGPVRETVARSGLRRRLGATHFFRNTDRAVAHLLADWDAEDDGDRRARYEHAVRTEAPEVAPSAP